MVKNFTTDMYHGGIQNWEIQQDSRGVIYVANNFGLLQYDGNTWRNYPVPGATKLRSIALDGAGRIYAGLQGDFGYYEPDTAGFLRYYSLKILIPEFYRNIGETWRTYYINDKVYFCTFRNIYIYDGNRVDVVSSNETLDISYHMGNELYTQIPGKGLYMVKNKQLYNLPYGAVFKDKIVSGMLRLNTNEALISTSRNGIYKVNRSNAEVWNYDLNELFKKTFINNMVLLKSGEIAIGTQHNGIYIINQDGEIILNLDKEHGIQNHTVLSLFEDLNNNLWIGQNNGITYARLKSPFTLLNEEVGIPGTGYSAVGLEDKYYLGTNNGTYLYNSNELKLLPGSEGQVYRIQEINDQLLMSHHNGSFKIDGDEIEKLDDPSSSWMFVEFGDYILKGIYSGVQILDKSLNVMGHISNHDESSRIIVRENDTTVWIAHGYKGLYKLTTSYTTIEEPRIAFYNAKNGLPSDFYNSVEWINGELKFITANGIYNYSHLTDEFIIDSELSAFFEGEQIIGLKSDVFGNVYFITDNSVGFLERIAGKEFVKHDKEFTPIKQLLNDDLPNINVIGPSVVLFGAKDGFIVFDRNLFWTTENEIFITLIRNISYGNDSRNLLYGGDGSMNNSMSPELEYRDNQIHFEFSSLAFSTTIEPEFQYRLDGFENQWSEWTSTNTKEYTNLPEGNYTFLVRSRNAIGQISESATYDFKILAPWYRTNLAYGGYTVLIILTLGSLITFMNKRHVNERERLEQKRLEQLSMKEEELSSFTKQTESEINRLKNEKLESELRHMNTELATNTMHLLNKNEFINGIKLTLESVEKKSVSNEVKTQIKRVIKDISKNIETDGDWEHFQIHFDKVHGNFSSRIKKDYPGLTPQEIKLSAYLRLNLSTKEIANLLNISVRGVEIARYRLRKKLALDRSQNLTEFILNY